MLSFMHSALLPVTTYSAVLEACTAAGCARSQAATITTLEDSPEGVVAPSLVALSEMSIQVTWNVPAQPNGVITSYAVYLNGSQVATVNGSSDRRAVVSGLQPATVYSVMLSAATAAGAGNSASVTVTTLEHVPSGISAPVASAISASAVTLSWSPPSIPNGRIVAYDIEQGASRLLLNLSSTTRMHAVTGLRPFTTYEFAVVACTAQGCSVGNETSVRTQEGVPQGIQPPTSRSLNSSAVEAVWPPPTSPNGVMLYSLYIFGPELIAGAVNSQSRLLSSNAQSPFVATGLLAFQSYHFVVEARTSAGAANSTHSNTVQTAEAGKVLLLARLE